MKALTFGVAAWLACAVPLIAQTRLLDDFTDVSEWQAAPAPGVTLDISTDSGRTGRAMRLDFDFGTGAGYAIARLPLNLELPDNYEFSFWVRGNTAPQTLEFKLIDPSGENVWWSVRRPYRFPSEWQRVRIRKRHLGFAWGPQGGGDIRQTSALEIVVTAAEGGRGTVWIDELTLTALPPERPFAEERNAFSDRSEIDFGRRRELGGLRLVWERPQPDYDVQLSSDQREWDTVWRARGSDGGVDWVFIPDGEGRYVRIVAPNKPREIEVLPATAAESKTAMFETIARRSPRGHYPKHLLGEQSYWTIVGAPADTREALISEDGTIDIDPVRFSIEPFVRAGKRLLTWADAKLTQSLEDGELPIPSVVRDHGDLRLTTTAFVSGEEGHSILWVRYRLESNLPTNATLMLAIRPIQVNPGWQFLARPGGATDITSIRRDDAGITINDTTTIIPLIEPHSFAAIRFDQGDMFGARLSSPALVRDSFASATATLHYDLELRAREPKDVVFAIPFHATPARLGTDFEAELNANRTLWRARLGRVAIHLPPEAAHIARAIRSNLAYILINADGPSIQPGSRSYDRSWIRDGSLTSAALLRLGHPEEVRRFIEWYARFQRADGYVPCCVSFRGGDPVPEHDSHGQFIYLVKEYYDFTGDRAFLQQMWPHVERAVGYIETLRRQRMTPEYQTEEKRAFFGLVPESISHEGYSAKPMHSYWDDFFILTGLKDATEIATILGEADATRFAAIRDEFRANLYASIARAMANHKIDFIPGSVELGDFDATSTTTAINPGGELRHMPQPATQRTFDRYWEDFVARRDGARPWENYTPYEWRTVGTFIRLGQPQRAHEITRWFFTHVRPPAWNHWAEVVWNDPKTPKFIGDMPHTWVGSDFIRSIIDMFAFEREDGALVIGAGIPAEWVSRRPIGVEKLRTPYGPLTWTMTRDGADIIVRIEKGIEIPPAGIVIGDRVIRELPAEVSIAGPSALGPRPSESRPPASAGKRPSPEGGRPRAEGAATGFIFAGEQLAFDARCNPQFTRVHVENTHAATREGLTRWAKTARGCRQVKHFSRPDYRVFIVEDETERGMGRAPQPSIGTMVSYARPANVKVYQVILNPALAVMPRADSTPFDEPVTPAELMAAAWAGEMLHIDFYSRGIVLPHHDRSDFQKEWQEIATELGYPTLQHADVR